MRFRFPPDILRCRPQYGEPAALYGCSIAYVQMPSDSSASTFTQAETASQGQHKVSLHYHSGLHTSPYSSHSQYPIGIAETCALRFCAE